MRLTRRGWALAASGVVAWLLARTLGVAELHLLAVVALALLGLSALAVRVASVAVSARRRVTRRRVEAGEGLEVTLELRNDARLPTPLLLVEDAHDERLAGRGGEDVERFAVRGLAPGQVTARNYALLAAVRGRARIGPLAVRVRDPYGLVERVRRYAAVEEVIVYPRIEPVGASFTRGAHLGAGTSAQRRPFASGDEFYTMREYVTGDDLRLVHWPSTAHRNTIMVRQMEQGFAQNLTVFLDARSAAHTGATLRTSTLEKAVSVAASMLRHFTDLGYGVRLLRDSSTERTHPRQAGDELDLLAVLEPSDVVTIAPALQRLGRGEGLLVAVLGTPPGHRPLGQHPDVRALLVAGRGYKDRVALVATTAAPDNRADRLVELLCANGWQAATVAPGQPLDARWREATRRDELRRRVPAGSRP